MTDPLLFGVPGPVALWPLEQSLWFLVPVLVSRGAGKTREKLLAKEDGLLMQRRASLEKPSRTHRSPSGRSE